MGQELTEYEKQNLEEYYADDGKKIRTIVNQILSKWRDIDDYDHFYSIANEVFANILYHHRYNPSKGDFRGFLYSSIHNKIKTDMRRRNEVDKEKLNTYAISLYTPIGKDSNSTIGDLLKSDYDLEVELLDKFGFSDNHPIKIYFRNLSKNQKKILLLLADGYKPAEIKELLHMSRRDYIDNMLGIEAYEYLKVLY